MGQILPEIETIYLVRKGEAVPSLKPISILLSQAHLRKLNLKVLRHMPGPFHSQGVKEQV